MYNKLSLSIALYGLLITPLSPLGVYESYNIVDFVNRNFETDDQSKPNRVKTHNPLSYQSPNILTNIEGVPNLDTQQFVKVERVERLPKSLLPQYVIRVTTSRVSPSEGETIYIVREVREVRQNADDSEIDERLRRY
jgi:hypothetical protein